MGKSKHHREKNDRLSPRQGNDSKSPELLQNKTNEFEITFEPLFSDAGSGAFENVHLFEKMLPVLEGYAEVFAYDYSPGIENYSEWLESQLEFARSIAPWIFIVMVNGEPDGLIWAFNWESTTKGDFSVEMGGMARRGTKPAVTCQTIHAFLDKLFQETAVYIVRGDCAATNRAARMAMFRAGMRHPEPRRVWQVKGGQEITGIIYSMTRSEWEAR